MFLLFKGYIKLEYTTNKTAYSKDQELFVLNTLDKYLQRKKTWPATGINRNYIVQQCLGGQWWKGTMIEISVFKVHFIWSEVFPENSVNSEIPVIQTIISVNEGYGRKYLVKIISANEGYGRKYLLKILKLGILLKVH